MRVCESILRAKKNLSPFIDHPTNGGFVCPFFFLKEKNIKLCAETSKKGKKKKKSEVEDGRYERPTIEREVSTEDIKSEKYDNQKKVVFIYFHIRESIKETT